MKLFAISDLHVSFPPNRQWIEKLAPHPDDWLILGGDLGETEQHLTYVLDTLRGRFAKLIWIPGNHELWTVSADPARLRGEAKYRRLVEICQARGVLTPEDPYPRWPHDPTLFIVPLFVLYDYSFRPDDVKADDAVAWAIDGNVLCADESLLHSDPYPSRSAWCEARVIESENRLAQLPADSRTVLVNHFPLRMEHARTPQIPRFSIWCGTRRTQDWHLRYRAKAVVYGHLHLRSSIVTDGVRFEECSLGYPHQWHKESGFAPSMKQILPDPRRPLPA